MNPAVMGAMMLALWALQRHNERRQQRRNQRHSTRDGQNSRRLRRMNSGNPMPAPFGFGF
jgi:hypothetical protein